MDHFSTLPDEIIASIFRLTLSDKSKCLAVYRRLHLVCRRWDLVCANWSEHLPKYDSWFNLRFKEDGCSVTPSLLSRLKCTNYEGQGDGPKLIDMLRHYNRVELMGNLIFDSEELVITDALLLQLIENKLTNITNLAFQNCDMSGLTEEVMLTFLTAVAESKRCRNVEIFSDVQSAQYVLTDRSLAPIISSGVVEFLDILWSTPPSTTIMNITDDTLVAFAQRFPQRWFAFRMGNSVQQITAHGILQVIEAFCASDCSIKETSYLAIPFKLKPELLNLRAPNDIETRNKERWIYKRLSSHPFREGQLVVTFDSQFLDDGLEESMETQ